jgi:pimeloyl-ACP methyl ester carboxylesterase
MHSSNDSSAPHARRHDGAGAGLMTTVEANGVTLGVEHFGDAAAPLVLLAGGTTMLSWPDALCEALVRGGRHVVRYDLRDSGTSTTVNPEAPTYKLRDLAADAAALARELDDRPAHLAGIGVGGMVAQVAALDYPGAFSALTLAGTRPVAPGRVDEDLPDHDSATMERLFSRPMPDWSDRAAVAEFATAGAEILGDDPVSARATAERIWDRTPGTEPAVQMANQLGMVFAKLDCKPRWRERLSELAMPALVVHGRRDPFFPVGNGEALAREIPGARLLVLERAATAIPDAIAGEVAAAMLALLALTVPAPTAGGLHRRAVFILSNKRMEPLWSPAVATRGNRWQMGRPQERLKQAKTAPARAVAIRPPRLTVAAAALQLEHLTLLSHLRTSSIDSDRGI